MGCLLQNINMNQLQVLCFFLFLSGDIFGQINIQDSTVQVIAYWEMDETYDYSISLQRLQYSETDTILNETMTYEVEVSVIDSTTDAFTVKWFYKNFKTNSTTPITQKVASAAEDIVVEIIVDELGVIQGVKNWESIRDYMAESMDLLVEDLNSIPGGDKVLNQIKSNYGTKTSIEASAIQDAQQFHNFYGGKFKLKEVATGRIKVPNLYDNHLPFDSEVRVELESIDQENNHYLIRSIQEVNSEQLTEMTYQYLKEIALNLDQEFVPRESFQPLTNVIETVSLMHNSGWVVESKLWKEVLYDGVTNLEIRSILLK